MTSSNNSSQVYIRENISSPNIPPSVLHKVSAPQLLERNALEVILQELQEIENDGVTFFNIMKDSYVSPYTRIEAQRKIELLMEKLQKFESSCSSNMILNLKSIPADNNMQNLLNQAKKDSMVNSSELQKQRNQILDKTKIVQTALDKPVAVVTLKK